MYNRQDVFKKHIQKKAEELNELCKQLGVVSFMSFAVKDCDNETEYKNYIYGSASNGIHLNVDHIRHHVNVANGFMTVPPADNPDLDNYIDDIIDIINILIQVRIICRRYRHKSRCYIYMMTNMVYVKV